MDRCLTMLEASGSFRSATWLFDTFCDGPFLVADHTTSRNWKSLCCSTNSASYVGKTPRATMTTVDRLFLAAASRLLPRARWRSFIITPTTLLRWPYLSPSSSVSICLRNLDGRVNRS